MKPIIALLAIVLLVACSPRPGEFVSYSLSESDIVAVQQTVRTSLKDPQAAHFGQIMATLRSDQEWRKSSAANGKSPKAPSIFAIC
jgi:hypothetical protein